MSNDSKKNLIESFSGAKMSKETIASGHEFFSLAVFL